ncbi:MAG: AGE family epimerase/isomerase [Muribaculaceae bacterium]|nr:AGE family epimerase/isomerase [Muribaculaceae bacterium]
MDWTNYLKGWADRYRDDLTANILPFWLRHGSDNVNGGVYTCLDRDGALMDPTKSVWFQGRCAWTFAAAYNRIDPRPEYLEFARSCIEFSDRHCYDPADGRMYFEVAADGTPLRRRRYVFSECFAIIAKAEYAMATGQRHYADEALALFREVNRWLETPGVLEPKYLPAQPAIGHSITMIMINTAATLRRVVRDPLLDAVITRNVETLRLFMHPEYEALLETVAPDGSLIDTLAGRTINPGHCIETAWFLLDEARHRQDDSLTEMALTILEWSWKWGWDEQYGGIINFRDCKGFPNQDYSQDMKFWWPQTEAVIATLAAYRDTGDEKWLRRHQMACDWAYAHFPDHQSGEWFGYLHRDGSVAQSAKGNIFKGPFHIPRMMIRSCEIIDDILQADKH